MEHAGLRPHLVGYAIVGALFASVLEPAHAAPPTLYCIVSQDDDDGVWVASRSVTERDGAFEVSRDTYEWQPHERIEFAPGMTLGWSLNYFWPVAAGNQPNIPPEEVTVDLTFRFDRAKIGRDLKRPDRTWLHLYRSWSASNGPSATASSLSDMMLWSADRDGNLSGRSVLTYDTLMAFGTSRNALAWSIRAGPDASEGVLGRTWDQLPIADLRGKIDQIPRLRKSLDRHAANFRKNCGPALIQAY
jgi:hypothetical protein